MYVCMYVLYLFVCLLKPLMLTSISVSLLNALHTSLFPPLLLILLSLLCSISISLSFPTLPLLISPTDDYYIFLHSPTKTSSSIMI